MYARVFLRSSSGIIGVVGVALIVLVAIVAPPLLDGVATADDYAKARQLPSWQHFFGTDALGRDLLARMLVATRLSVGMAVVAEILSLCIALPIGGITALIAPGPRAVVMRVIDTMLALPGLIVTIYLATILSPAFGLFGLAVGIAVPSAFRLARVVSTQALSIASQDYFMAAKVVGVSRARVLFRYVLPNIAEPIMISAAISVVYAILSFSGLSFLGIGVQPPDFDWGNMLTEGVNSIYVNPMAALGPLAFISFAALSFAFVGEALARASNPRLWTVNSSDTPAVGSGGFEQQAKASARADGVLEKRTADRGQPLLCVQDLRVRFAGSGGSFDVVKGVSFELERGEMLGIVGESGSGKSMTVMSIAKLIPYPGVTSGHIVFHGRDLDAIPNDQVADLLGTKLAVVFQDPMSSLNPAVSLGRQLTEGVEHHRKMSRAAAQRLAADRLRAVNIPDADRQLVRFPHELSGGMRQRVMIAMGLMNEPELLICDEPTTALDVTVQAQIMELLNTLNAERGLSIILISHNLALVRQNCQRVIVMYAGQVVEELPSDRLLRDARHPYTRALIGAVPDNMSRPRAELLTTIPGQPPDPSDRLPGCPFRPRCMHAVNRCAEEMPPLVRASDGHRKACWVDIQKIETVGSVA